MMASWVWSVRRKTCYKPKARTKGKVQPDELGNTRTVDVILVEGKTSGINGDVLLTVVQVAAEGVNMEPLEGRCFQVGLARDIHCTFSPKFGWVDLLSGVQRGQRMFMVPCRAPQVSEAEGPELRRVWIRPGDNQSWG
jgi:hypothetical protein